MRGARVSVPQSVRWLEAKRSGGGVSGPAGSCSALRPSKVKDESQMAGTRRPEGLLAAGGGRRSGAGIADVQRPTLPWGEPLGTGHSGKEGTPAPSATEAEGEGALERLKGFSPALEEGPSRSQNRWVDELETVPAHGVSPFLLDRG